MLMVLGAAEGNYSKAARLWNQRYPERTPHSRNVFKRLQVRGEKKGILLPDHNKNQKIKRPVRDQCEVAVLASAIVEPHLSVRERATDAGVSHSLVHVILKDHKMKAYRASLHQSLTTNDKIARLQFCRWINNKSPAFHLRILFTDECTFKSDGSINRWNRRFWAPANPHWLIESDHQRLWKVNVWCGILNDQIIGPFFIEGNLNSRSYCQFLRENLHELLENVPLQKRRGIYFQQDGCPAHTARITRACLNEIFLRKWISKFGPRHWPARSPDLTVLDFYLWGRIKDLVYATRPTTAEDMKIRITEAIRSITPAEIRRAVNNFRVRTEACEEVQGSHIEHLL